MTGLPVTKEPAFADSATFWRAVAFATAPAQRANAEAGIRQAYASAGLTPPATVVWCRSPQEAARLAASPPAAWGASVRETVRTQPWEAARRELHTLLGGAGWARAWALAAAPLTPLVGPLCRRIREAVIAAVEVPPLVDSGLDAPRNGRRGANGQQNAEARIVARQPTRTALTLAVQGQHDAPWLSVFEAAARHLDGFGAWPSLEGIAKAARNAGWWWPYENAVLIAERPNALHLDELGRLHRGDGPALSWADGFALHAWSGMAIAPDFVETLTTLTPAQMRDEPNAELRRVMFEYYGYERFLRDSDAKPIGQDEAGKLWRIDLAGDEPIVMVEVVNSTPEPDGTFSVYWLRVPPTTQTAKAGVAWTFGLTEAEYQPSRQT